MTVQLDVRSVSKRYGGVLAVAEISLSVSRGEHVAIIGPNGAGKSTLFGMIAGEHVPTSGSIHFDGTDVTSWPPSKRALHGISRTFQVARMFATASVFDNVLVAAMAGQARAMRWRDRFHNDHAFSDRAAQVISRTGLEAVSGQEAGTLAQGDRKRLEMAMALVQEPKLLLLDEPTAGMSYEDALGTIELLKGVCADEPELTVVLTAHDMEVIFALAQRVILMAEGKAEVEGTPAEVAADPKTRDVYLGRPAA